MIPGWTPPTPRPITPHAYALCRVYIEGGCAATKPYIESGLGKNCSLVDNTDFVNQCLPNTKPKLHEMAVYLYRYIPAEMVPLAPAQEVWEKYVAADHQLGDEDRPGWPTFVDRTALLKALASITPAEVLAKVGPLNGTPDKAGNFSDLEGAAEGDDAGLALQWWVVALAAGGLLFWLGRGRIAGAAIGWIARQLLKGLVLAGAITLTAEAAKRMLQYLSKSAKKGAAGLFSLLLVGGAVVGGGMLLARSAGTPP